MYALIWVVSGLLVGSLAHWIARNRGYGIIGDNILGVLGALAGGWIFLLAGVTAPHPSPGLAASSLFGGLVVLAIARVLRPVARETRKLLTETSAGADLDLRIRHLGKIERAALDRLLRRDRPLKNPNVTFEEQLTFGQRTADRVAAFGGSWNFIGLFLLLMLAWMVFNTETVRHFDPYPFILLNLVLSCLAALQAPVIMMSQNRQTAKDRLDAQHDFEVNVRSELEIARLHAKFDAQQGTMWEELMRLQRRQLELLESIAAKAEGR
jgi:uncharacterized membrane protein/uncharacterized membrane protein YeaQ/YmgE (transglycosylase-associated protein family)